MKNRIYFFIFLTGIILIFFIFSVFSGDSFEKGKEGAVIEVSSGEGIDSVGQKLKRENIIDSVILFKAYSWMSGKESQIKAGKYNLNSEMSVKEIVNKMAGGNVIQDIVTIRITEGKRLSEIADILKQQEVATREEFLEITGYPQKKYKEEERRNRQQFANNYDFLQDKPAEYGLEGYLFPDTYEFYKNIEAEKVVMKMLNNFSRKLTPDIRQEIKERGKTVHEIITMASLLEKEARTEEEMKIVAGIFWDRMEEETPLQSCATIAYALGKDKIKYSNLDTEIDSPYNTYRHKGLPPAPIGNPGLKAIRAAIDPTETDYRYFLSPVGSDKTLFSETYEEHLRKKRQYVD